MTPVQDTWPAGKLVTLTAKTSAALQTAVNAAAAGDTIHCPAGVYTGSTVTVKDGINVSGAGIYKGGAGTWLQFSLRWGSHSHFRDFLVGKNADGTRCSFTPLSKSEAASGSDTRTNGSHDCAFSRVRFKGGSDKSSSILELAGNWSKGWITATNPVCDYFLLDTKWYDCEFERGRAVNSVGTSENFANGNPGSILNLWSDSRKGGGYIHGNRWYRCHFGVKNGARSASDINGWGIGTGLLIQPGPNGNSRDFNSPDCGPSTNGGSSIMLEYPAGGGGMNGIPAGSGNWNGKFNWAQVDHGNSDNAFEDCLFEYSTWYPMNLCDQSRPYSMWQGCKLGYKEGGKAQGWGNQPGSHWPEMPEAVWNSGWNMTRCYHKGRITGSGRVIGENTKASKFIDCTMGGSSTFFNKNGLWGNVVSGAHNGIPPVSPIFIQTQRWTGSATSYTPSPYDAA